MISISYATAIFDNVGQPTEREVSDEEKMEAVQVLLALKDDEVKKYIPKLAVRNALRFMWEEMNEAKSQA